jgi:hypothetical protein
VHLYRNCSAVSILIFGNSHRGGKQPFDHLIPCFSVLFFNDFRRVDPGAFTADPEAFMAKTISLEIVAS